MLMNGIIETALCLSKLYSAGVVGNDNATEEKRNGRRGPHNLNESGKKEVLHSLLSLGFMSTFRPASNLRFPLLLAVEASAILALRLVYDTSAMAVRAARIYRPCLGAAATPCDDDSGAHLVWRRIPLRR